MYTPPIDDMRFVLNHVARLPDMLERVGKADTLTPDVIDAILEEAGRLAATVIAPTNRDGDVIGAKRSEDGSVITPPGFAEAYQALADGGWTAMEASEDYGGQAVPMALSAMVNEMWQSANMGFALCHLLTQGLISALEGNASPEQKAVFIPPMVEGRWTGTMNLTEPQAGTDLAAIRTKAVREGTHYRLTGQKIYITYGEHDMAENIIHLVLARTPDAPAGVKGISVFIVPKFLINADGSLGAENDVECIALEKKLGIKGSPTATLVFGAASGSANTGGANKEDSNKENPNKTNSNIGAIGYLVGAENQGLQIMFAMMNHARFAVGLQGLAISERAFQQAVSYAHDRKQGTPLMGETGDPIIHHPDVLRLLATMQAEITAMRALTVFTGAALDQADADPVHEPRAAVLIPIIKGWLTERAQIITSQAIQVHGGMGFIEETGVAQHYRDARILPIYEGTTAIQANDLVFRKIIRDEGEAITQLLDEIEAEIKDNSNIMAEDLAEAVADARHAIAHILSKSNAPHLAAASGVSLLMLLGTVLGGFMMFRVVAAAASLKNAPDADANFINAQLDSANIYRTHCLPEVASLLKIICHGDTALGAVNPKNFGR